MDNLKDVFEVRFSIFKLLMEDYYNDGNKPIHWWDLRDSISNKIRNKDFKFVKRLMDEKVVSENDKAYCMNIDIEDVQKYIKLFLEVGILVPKTNNVIIGRIKSMVVLSDVILNNFGLDDLNHIERHGISMNQHLRLSKIKKLAR